MKLTLLLLAIIVMICVVWMFFRPVRIQVYRLDSALNTQWIAIEYGRNDCQPLADGFFWREIIIPPNGYLCTSSAMEKGWTFDMFYLDTGARLDNETNILARGGPISTLNCHFDAETFLFKRQPNDRPSNFANTFIDEYHPECNRGIQTNPSQ